MMSQPNNKLVLIVDDTPINIGVISGVLKGSYRTKVATNGEKALALAEGPEKPDLILLDVLMPGMDGYEVCRHLKANPATRDIPVIFLTAKTDAVDEENGFDVGAVDYIHKPFSGPIVLARVKTQLALQAALAQAREANAALTEAHNLLQSELAEAASYVRSQLPPLMSQPFAVDWRFVPFAALGGDSFGYHWIDSDHFALYLLDVCGHGVGPSLMSIAVLHLLQAASLPDVDFRDPSQVLAALNNRYQMKDENDLYFTLWYGVYQPSKRRLDYSCGGHPPAVLVDERNGVQLLKARGNAVGFWPDTEFVRETLVVPERSQLYLFSDGAYEVERPDGTLMRLEDLTRFITRRDADTKFDLDLVFQHLVQERGNDALKDDFSIVRFGF